MDWAAASRSRKAMKVVVLHLAYSLPVLEQVQHKTIRMHRGLKVMTKKREKKNGGNWVCIDWMCGKQLIALLSYIKRN